MTIYRHTYSGSLPQGDTFQYGWWSNSSLNVTDANTAALAWAASLWQTGGAGSGCKAYFASGVVHALVRTAGMSISPSGSARKDGKPSFKTVSVATGAFTQAGTAVGDSNPQTSALVVYFKTTDASKHGRGRMYLPTIAAFATAANGSLTTGAQTEIVADLHSAFTGAIAAGLQPVCFVQQSGKYDTLQGSAVNIASFGISTTLGTQRRRTNKVVQARSSRTMP